MDDRELEKHFIDIKAVLIAIAEKVGVKLQDDENIEKKTE